MMFQDLFKQYLELIENQIAKHSFKCYESVYKKYIKENQLGLTKCSDIKYPLIQTFINDMMKTKAPKTAKNVLSVINQVVKLGEQLEVINKNPCRLVKIKPFDNRRYFNHSLEVQKKIIKSIRDFKDPLADFLFFLIQGRRVNEIRLIKWRDIDFKNNEYTIISEHSKVRKTMKFYLIEELSERLKKRLYDTDFYKLDDYVFTNPITQTHYNDFRRLWERFLNTYDLPKFRMHDLRHLVGTYSINYLGQSIESVMHTLGHTNINTTKRYITQQTKQSKEVMTSIFLSV